MRWLEIGNNPILAPAAKIGFACSMPMQNRVTPEGNIVAIKERGLFMGNRGILHDAQMGLTQARWRHHHWIICVLSFKGWHREVMQPGTYTELFFMDEATALAAGHRPCALCRKAAYLDFQNRLTSVLHQNQRLNAQSLDRMLHATRIETRSRRQRRFGARLDDLPDGVMVTGQVEAPNNKTTDIWLVNGPRLLRWRPGGYDRAVIRRHGIIVEALTPRPSILALQQGYRPVLHPSAPALMERSP